MQDSPQLPSKHRDRLARRRFLQVGTVGFGSAVGIGQTHASSSDADGEPKSTDVTEIEDWHDLDAVRDDLDGEYVLVDDLDEETEGYDEYVGDPEEGWKPIGEIGDAFAGTFNGQGYEIADVEIDGSGRLFGLFSTNEGTIEKVTLTAVDIIGGRAVGGIVGRNDGEVRESAVHEVDITGGSRRVGGLVGVNSHEGEVWESAVYEADITGDGGVGGLAGGNFGEICESSVRGADITGDSNVCGLVGSNSGEVWKSSVHEADITGEFNVGGLTGWYLGEVRSSYYNLDSVQLNGEQQLTVGGIFDQQYQDWLANDRELILEEYDSLPKNDGWIELTSTQSVRDALGFIDDPELNWRLETDLDLTGDDAGLYFPYFAGTLDGNHYTITVELDLPNIVNVGIVGRHVGDLFALTGSGTITGYSIVGGLVGQNNGEVWESSMREANITSDGSVGGLVGENWAESKVGESDVSKIDITGGSTVGGLVGANSDDSEIRESSVREADITSDGSIGGLVASNRGEVCKSSVREADITGNSAVGGVVGQNVGEIRESLVREANITGDSDVGGLVGTCSPEGPGDISEVWVAGDVTGNRFVGAFIGRPSGTVTAGYWDTEATDQSDAIGVEDGDDDVDVTGLTTDEMHGEAATEHMDALDFETTWAVQTDPDDYPTLQWQAPDSDPETGTVTGTVTDDNGDPLEAIELEAVTDDTGEIDATTTTDENGEYAFEPAATQTYEIVVGATGYERFRTELAVKTDETHTIDIELTPDDGPSVGDYTDEDDAVDTNGLRDAIDDWREGELDTGLLRSVIDAWRSGHTVG